MRLLWLKTGLLHPLDTGGKIRTFQMLRELKRGNQVTYLTLDDGTATEHDRRQAQEYCDELICVPHRFVPRFSARFYAELARNVLSPLPYGVARYRSRGMAREVAARAPHHEGGVLVCDFLNASVNVPGEIACPTVLFQHNVEALIWQRHADVQRNRLKRAYLRHQWQKMRRYERSACARFDVTIAVSAEDRETLRREYGLPHVEDVPTGVDAEFFRPTSTTVPEPHSLIFTGSMDWIPNEDAVLWFAEDIMPRVRARLPEATLAVVGRNPRGKVVRLSERDPSISVSGRVDDVRPYIERAAAYVVPLRIGSGTRLKVLEAMAMEKPVISTSIGAEGLPLQDGEHLVIADTREQFAEAVVGILSDEAAGRALGRRAAAAVREQFAWSVAGARFAEICEGAARRHPSRSAG